MRCAPAARRGFSPLDEELELLPGHLTPSLVEGLVRLGAWLPFEPAAAVLASFTNEAASEGNPGRRAAMGGAGNEAGETARGERMERERPAGAGTATVHG